MVGRVILKHALMAPCLAAVLCCQPGYADSLPDPTRPTGETAAPVAAGGVAVGPVLQSVMISPSRRSAIISGERVTVGSRHGEATVTRITETEVVLKNGNEIQTLKLFPAVEKSPAGRGAKASGSAPRERGRADQSGQKTK